MGVSIKKPWLQVSILKKTMVTGVNIKESHGDGCQYLRKPW